MSTRLHASCVSVRNSGLLILGPSGSGKSGLALQLMALGADLIADDQTLVETRDDRAWASAPDTLRGVVEARGLGLLAAEAAAPAPLLAAVDLGQVEKARLPVERSIEIDGCSMPLFHKVESPYFAAFLVQYLKAGKADR